MRQYYFPVRFTVAAPSPVLCSVRLNPRRLLLHRVLLMFGTPMPPADAADFREALTALHDVNMHSGYCPDTSAEQAIRSGRTGISCEIEVEPRSITYIVERPACNPALSMIWLWRRIEERLGPPAPGSMIVVSGED